MCGIAGIIAPQKNSASALQQMIAAIAHRGPDGEFSWKNDDETVHFAHRRLAIIDLTDAGRQPMHYMGRYTIVHNGEIYNYKDLRKTLEKKSYHFNSSSDTEVIMAAYDYWGTNCLQHFNGMFAFAIWDEKEKKFFAARDRFGQKPFYYFFDEKKELFAFASEMKALLTICEKHINEKEMLIFLSLGLSNDGEDLESTFYTDIKQLAPAHFLQFDSNHQGSIHQYYDLSKQINELSDEDAIESFLQKFRSSIEYTFNADVNIGTSLSGGLDSSSIAAMASGLQAKNNSYQAFTAVFPGFEKDESNYSAHVARQFNLHQHTVSPGADDFVNDLEKFLWYQDRPVSSASAYTQYKVFELAKQHGIKVLLDGQGADEILAGYFKYLRWANDSTKSRLAKKFPFATAKLLERKAWREAKRNEDLNSDLINYYKFHFVTKPVVRELNDLLYFNTMISGLDKLLHYADRNSMAHGCEVRLPFLDHRLVEFIFSLPLRLKIRGGETKWVLRKTVENILPVEITWRKDKIGFEPPQKRWMQNKSVEELTRSSKKSLVNAGYLNKAVLEKKYSPHGSYEEGAHEWRYLVAGMMV